MNIQNTTSNLTPYQIRMKIRQGKLVRPTAGLAPGYVQTNIAILPKELSYDFLLFCQRNPRSCPLIEVLDIGTTEAILSAPNSDIRTDLPLYRIYKNGVLFEEVADIKKEWRDDFVTFLIGCSFTFESALIKNGIHLPHFDQGKNVSMFITNIPTTKAGAFSGPMVVSMRPIEKDKVIKTIQTTSRFPSVHGAPIHIGTPKEIGINDINKPDFGDVTRIKENEIPVFWACGVTPQSIAMSSSPSIMITHSPGHMFITDRKDEEYAII
jgi:uncharacterized protein YcsI (UPF0317 family)